MSVHKIVDLLAIDFGDRQEMSLTILMVDRSRKAEDKLLGPVPYKNAVTALAPMLLEAMPETFSLLKEAETYLTMVHMMNVTRNENKSGISYPWKVAGIMGRISQ